MKGCFVTGTDTGAGKTVVAGAITAALREQGRAVRALKPLLTGLDEPESADWPADHTILAAASGYQPEEVVLATFGPPVSPHLALEMTGEDLDPAALLAGIRETLHGAEVAVVEGVGGLLVPLSGSYDICALAQDIGLPLVLAARPGLGTINHTLLTLQAARGAGLTIAGVVMTPWPQTPSAVERSNRMTVSELGEVEVAGLPWLASAEPELLAQAGRELPLERWLALEQ